MMHKQLMTSAELIKLLKANGWTLKGVTGSHHQFRHPTNPMVVTVPHPRKDMKPGTLANILRTAGLKKGK
jgi:predicted RNA binding protein YcfA (HicA-like mRNA interferase family)